MNKKLDKLSELPPLPGDSGFCCMSVVLLYTWEPVVGMALISAHLIQLNYLINTVINHSFTCRNWSLNGTGKDGKIKKQSPNSIVVSVHKNKTALELNILQPLLHRFLLFRAYILKFWLNW